MPYSFSVIRRIHLSILDYSFPSKACLEVEEGGVSLGVTEETEGRGDSVPRRSRGARDR